MNELDLLRQFGLLTPADEQRAREQSVYASLGGLAQALMAPRQRGQSALAQFGQAALQGYQAGEQSFDQTLQSILRRTQLEDLLAKRKEQDAARKRQAQIQQLIPNLYRERMGQVPMTIPTETYEDVRTTTEGVVGQQLDLNRLRQIGMLGQQGMEYASKVAQFESSLQPKFKIEKRKTTSGAEELVKIFDNGDVEVLGKGVSDIKPIAFDDQTLGYISLRFPGQRYEDLSPDQKREVLSFQNAPNDKDAAAAVAESRKVAFETGQSIPVPKSRSDYLREVSAGVKPSTPASPTEPVKTPSIPASVASKPIGPKEVPLIESSGVSPKQKQELLLAKPKQVGAVEAVVNTNRRMQQTIKDILNNPGFEDSFGIGGSVISSIPGTDAARVKALLEQLGGTLFIDAITAMRNASTTGAAVGSVTEREGDKLQSSQAALKQAQKASDARKELERLLGILEFQEKGVVNAFERTYGAGEFRLMEQAPAAPPPGRKPLSNIFGG